MNSFSNSYRSTQKKPPAVESSNPPQPPSAITSSSQTMPGSRSSSGSARSSTYRRPNPNQQLSQIEKSVTHLLVATKQLLETLTQWSRHTATEGEVSDVYVRLGYEFNIACRAFNSIGVETTDLGPVPELLRAILEDTLSQEASSASLDRFLPRIRDIIITLLHGLKRKQQRLRSKQVKENASSETTLQPSASSASLDSGLTQMLEDGQSHRSGGRGPERRTGSGSSTLAGNPAAFKPVEESGPPPRYPSSQPSRHNSGGALAEVIPRSGNRDSQRSFPASSSDSSISSSQSRTGPVLSSNTELPAYVSQRTASEKESASNPAPPPPPPPKQQDAFAALQRGGDLERRASRRYSAYQISKHLGASPNGVPMLPPAQHSPVPNRGRDVRESMNAVRIRGSGLLSYQKNSRAGEPSPNRNDTVINRISEESGQSTDGPNFQPPINGQPDDSPIIKTPEDKLRKPDARLDGDYPVLGANLTGPPHPDAPEVTYTSNFVEDAEARRTGSKESPAQSSGPISFEASGAQDSPQQFIPEDSPQPGKELTLFLQYKSKIKKFVLPDGANDLSIARLQLAFIEKFAWNTHSNGNDLPEIYIQDPISGVRHELEDLRDVKDRSVLVLNIEALDEVKRHIDDGLSGLRRMVEGVRTVVDGQQNALQRVTDLQQATSKEMTRITSTSPTTVPGVPFEKSSSSADKPQINGVRLRSTSLSKNASVQMMGVQSMRKDLAVMRQTFTSLVSDMNSSMAEVHVKASQVKTMAIEGVLPSVDSSAGRSYVNAGKKQVGEDSEKLVDRVDNLQDIVEDLRKDVVTRGVRPLPRQLETVAKNISVVTTELKKLQEYLKREKPVWTKIWEKELQLVCSDRDLLTMQEELAADLEDDLEKATQTFALVEQATKQQNIQSAPGIGSNIRNISKGLTAIAMDQDVDPVKAKDGVLGEVRALRPNHETRLEAIERAEKARQEELESRREGAFKKELGSFVEEGKLKKRGGVEEAERLRNAKDDKNRRDAWETQQERAAGKSEETENTAASTEELKQGEEAGQETEHGETPEQPTPEEEVKPSEVSPSRRTSWLPAIFTS
ncbi:MAG: hypothetical protein Q9214_002885 [Letrouitia sp. 1 TL-2023]